MVKSLQILVVTFTLLTLSCAATTLAQPIVTSREVSIDSPVVFLCPGEKQTVTISVGRNWVGPDRIMWVPSGYCDLKMNFTQEDIGSGNKKVYAETAGGITTGENGDAKLTLTYRNKERGKTNYTTRKQTYQFYTTSSYDVQGRYSGTHTQSATLVVYHLSDPECLRRQQEAAKNKTDQQLKTVDNHIRKLLRGSSEQALRNEINSVRSTLETLETGDHLSPAHLAKASNELDIITAQETFKDVSPMEIMGLRQLRNGMIHEMLERRNLLEEYLDPTQSWVENLPERTVPELLSLLEQCDGAIRAILEQVASNEGNLENNDQSNLLSVGVKQVDSTHTASDLPSLLKDKKSINLTRVVHCPTDLKRLAQFKLFESPNLIRQELSNRMSRTTGETRQSMIQLRNSAGEAYNRSRSGALLIKTLDQYNQNRKLDRKRDAAADLKNAERFLQETREALRRR